jgi:hypothetical protein
MVILVAIDLDSQLAVWIREVEAGDDDPSVPDLVLRDRSW